MKYFFLILYFFTTLGLGIAQNVGIGTSTPTRAKLEVYGAVGSTAAIFTDPAGPGISFQRNNPAIGYNQYFTDKARFIGSGKAFVQWMNMQTGSMNFDRYAAVSNPDSPTLSPSRVMTASQNGNVSFNSGDANASLFVGYSAGKVTAMLRGTTYHTSFYDLSNATTINAGKAGGIVFIGDVNPGPVYFGSQVNNLVGINHTDPLALNAHLDIKQIGDRGFALVEPSTFHNWEMATIKNITENGSDLYMFYNGNNMANFYHADGGYYYYSDKRLKTGIRNMPATLGNVLQLNPVSYTMKSADSADRLYGFLAQEVKPLFPQLVHQVNNKQGATGYTGIDDLYTIEYDGFAPIMIQAIQEQQDIITAIKQKNESLKQRITLIEEKYKSRKK